MKHSEPLIRQMERFSREHILTCPDLGRETVFPERIWAAMGDAGLLDPCRLDPGTPCTSIAAGARAMVATGGNLGLCLSWMIHQMTAIFLIYPHLEALKDEVLEDNDLEKNDLEDRGIWDRVRTGRFTVAFAVSEPKAGAHPKFMGATAWKNGGQWALSGEKAYLTNGPIARGFVVIAVTGREDSGRKEFSAFLVPRGTPGLSTCAPLEIPFFRPAPHGNIRLDSCRLGRGRMIGREGRAFDELVLPFRRLEDAAMAGAVSGAMAFLLSRASARLSSLGQLTTDQLETLGGLGAGVESLGVLADRMAGLADRKESPRESLNLFFRQAAARWLGDLNGLLEETGLELEGQSAILARDLAASARIGNTVAGIRKQKIGRRLIQDQAAPGRSGPVGGPNL